MSVGFSFGKSKVLFEIKNLKKGLNNFSNGGFAWFGTQYNRKCSVNPAVS
jgi:hypothetical protein